MVGDGKPEPFSRPLSMSWTRAFHPTAVGWRTSRTNRDGQKFTCAPTQALAADGSFPPTVARTPLWRPDGKEIFYRAFPGSGMMVVPVEASTEFSPGRPGKLFDGRFEMGQRTFRNYDISRDGERFLMVQGKEESASTEVVVVLNWFQELEKLVPMN